jgi:hypothetical protein
MHRNMRQGLKAAMRVCRAQASHNRMSPAIPIARFTAIYAVDACVSLCTTTSGGLMEFDFEGMLEGAVALAEKAR